MPITINAQDNEFAISSGSNVNNGPGTSTFDYPPNSTSNLTITSNQGEGFLLYAIAAPIIGGVSVFGGRGGTLGILGGVLLLTVIHVGLAIVYVPSFYVTMIGGVLIFIAVAVDALRVNVLGEG